MKLKHFLVYSLVYIGIVGAFVFIQNPGSYELSIFGFGLKLPVALWFILPIFILVFMSMLHLGYYSVKNLREKSSIKADKNLYATYAKELLLAKESDKRYKTEYFKTASGVTKFLSPWHDNEVEIENSEISEIITMIKKLNLGEVVDLRAYKLDRDNPLFIKNELNKLNLDKAYASEILRSDSSLKNAVGKRAYETLLRNATSLEIKKFDIEMSESDTRVLVERYIKDENFEITKDDLHAYIIASNFSEAEFISLAKSLSAKLSPDALIAMFDRLREKNPDAGEAYLYLLYEYGMIEELRQKLAYSDGEDTQKFELLLYLRDHGKSVPASYFFN